MGFVKRMKAQDVENDILHKHAHHGYSKSIWSKDVYPEIDIIEIYTRESGIGVQIAGNYNIGEFNTIKDKRFIRNYINCSNHLCYNGGFDIMKIIDDMVGKKINHKHGRVLCQGYEGSPKGRKKYRPCFNSFEYYIYVAYSSP